MRKGTVITAESGLPEGWANCKFGDIATIRNGYAFKSSWYKKTDIHVTGLTDCKRGVSYTQQAIRQSKPNLACCESFPLPTTPGVLKRFPSRICSTDSI